MNDANKSVTNKAKNQTQSLNSSAAIYQWVQDLCNSIITLEIKTIVTESQEAGGKMISTKINLIEGDITTTIHSDFVKDKKAIADFHKDQINKAEQIIKQNVETVKSIADALLDLLPAGK